MKGSRSRVSEEEWIEHRKATLEAEATAFERNLEHVASEIAARCAKPREAAFACQLAAQFHSLEEANVWRLIDMVMAAMDEKVEPK